MHTGVWLGKIKERNQLEELGVNENIIKLISKKLDGMA
jgi:hypothetical protein